MNLSAPSADMGAVGGMLPSIWRGDFGSAAAWQAARDAYAVLEQAADAIDDRLIVSRHPFVLRAWCGVCGALRPMTVTWRSFFAEKETASVRLAGTEVGHCHGCRLFSRVRALFSLLDRIGLPRDARVYAAERVTPAYHRLSQVYPDIVGSEFLGTGIAPGEIRRWGEHAMPVRHEDLTALSFADATFDAVVTLDVFEHVPAYHAAFRECRRVLRLGGHLLFTVPFFPGMATTEVRAVVSPDGGIHHLLPPEIHGNPVAADGALCFQHFGWDMLDDLRTAGFASAVARLYWGPWQGHIGLPAFVFHAIA